MGIFDFGFGGGGSSPAVELPEIFPLDINKVDFVRTDLIAIFTKILTDVAERTHGINDDFQMALWDSFLKSESSKGLITKLSEAMADQSDLFLLYDKALKLLREPDQTERAQIEDDYRKQGRSKLGIYISFSGYRRSQMVKIYSALEYCVIGGLNKNVNLSNALLLKMNDLRSSTALNNSQITIDQAKAIADALKAGRSSLLDAKDIVELPQPNMDPIAKALSFLNEKRAFYLGLPAAYITGIQTGGLGSTGEQDTKAVERGLKNYYLSIFKPICEALFEVSVSYKSQDFRQISQALEALKTFELIEDQSLITQDEKRIVIASLLDLEAESDVD